jgi:hypothetical protein
MGAGRMEVGYLVKVVLVELADETGKVGMLEEAG